ncbi:hypothetical protein ACOSQ3_014512 [Xanthoceras sorbifolium]
MRAQKCQTVREGSSKITNYSENQFGNGVKKEADLRFPSNPWDRISETAKNLVRGMLSTDPSQRLTAQQVLDHPWMMNDIRYSETRVEITFKIAKNVVITKNFYTTKFLLDSSSKYH